MISRRDLLKGAAAGVCAVPCVAGAIEARPYRIGFLHASSPSAVVDATYASIFERELEVLGYIEGQKVTIEYRWAEGNAERLLALAAELVRREVAVIVAPNNPAIAAAKQATATIPIVMAIAVDPIGQGFISSFAKPGGNITGLTWSQGSEVAGKNLELLKDVVPRLSRVGGLVDGTFQGIVAYTRAAIDAAQKLRLVLRPVEFRAASDLEHAIKTIVGQGAQAVYVFGSPLTNRYRREIVELAAKHRLPDVYVFREGPDAGGLMSYGVSISDLYRRAAVYVDRILKGARPVDLPVEQPTKFELVINTKTAKALGLTLPPSLLLRADQIIE
jgi:putative tryptophan/tyrosine transport system substrate-binding protein